MYSLHFCQALNKLLAILGKKQKPLAASLLFGK